MKEKLQHLLHEVSYYIHVFYRISKRFAAVYYDKLVAFYREDPKKRTLQTALALFAAGVLSVLLLIGGVYVGLFGKLPNKTDLLNIDNHLASEIYASDGVRLGKYYIQERSDVSFEEINPVMINALVATEDSRFFEHNGVDWRSYGRVILKTLLLGNESSGGGSTLSQQLLKNLYPRENFGLLSLPVSKIKEAIVAQRLEEVYSKEQILTLYLNTVSFGENAFGIRTASERFFNTTPGKLEVEQAATLVGMLKATYSFNPRLFPERAKQRRNVVLSQMHKNGYLTAEELESLSDKPMVLEYKSESHDEGLATYFREYLRKKVEGICSGIEKENGEPYNIYTDGLKIFTTVDSKMQQYAESAAKSHMASLQKLFNSHWKGREPWAKTPEVVLQEVRKSDRYKRLKAGGKNEKEILKEFDKPVQMEVFTWGGEKEMKMSPLDSVKHYLMFLDCGFMAMDSETGEVKAWVGGINYQYFKYDHVNINAKRQVGSTFKPFLYTTALEEGFTPCDYFSNEQVTYEEYDDWSPGNAGGDHEGYYTLKGALTNSVNTVSVKVMMDVGPDKVADKARELGIQSELDEVPALALGAADISLYEMVGAYGAFSNGGYRVEPTVITKITDGNGKVIWQNKALKKQEPVIAQDNWEAIVEMLRGVVNRGTAASLRSTYNLPNDFGGKTGTTQSQADGWFIGFTPRLVTGAWVGSAYPSIHFRTIKYGQGARMALPIAAKFYQQLNKDRRYKMYTRPEFPLLSRSVRREMDCEDFSMEPINERPELFDFFNGLFSKDKENEHNEEYGNPNDESAVDPITGAPVHKQQNGERRRQEVRRKSPQRKNNQNFFERIFKKKKRRNR
ncbi:transglycosylase domain-containing protein [Limibacter armeniacum]|uniref:penicillin-binding protein 1A n=1 Tax=Limibacter armeniacum TaxID=466084 RepID=UPI002FE64B0F